MKELSYTGEINTLNSLKYPQKIITAMNIQKNSSTKIVIIRGAKAEKKIEKYGKPNDENIQYVAKERVPGI